MISTWELPADPAPPPAAAPQALALSRNNVEAALEWLLVHAEDEDAAAPPTQEQLRQVGWAGSSCGSCSLAGDGEKAPRRYG